MRPHTLSFRLSAATAIAGLMLAQALPQPAVAQPAPPATAAAAPGQQAADPPERAGWLSQITGTVSFHTQDQDQWTPAAMNYPVASGDGFWTEPNASAWITISSSRMALAGGTEIDVGTLDPGGLQATLPQGEVYLHLRDLAQNETWSVQTPRGLMTFAGQGRYDVAAGDTQNPTTVTVLEGSVQVTGPGLSLQVAQGQTATITGTDTFQGTVGAAQMDAFITAMQQAEQPPAAASPTPAVAPPPVVAQIPGGGDLSAYGSWSDTTDNGPVWYPQVAAGWAPYRDGHWAFIPPWGWTWVDDAPWGFAPFHYGRWAEFGGRWGWTPGEEAYDGPPVYAPALVAFIGLGVGVGIGEALARGSVGWIPLGPHEAYHPWYRTSDRYLRSVNRRDVTNVTIINNRNVTVNNFANRRAATVVPASAMAESRPVRQVAQRVDPRTLESARPVVGTAPIRPTAATAGVTPGLARQMRLAPAPAGFAAAAHTAPGPAIHAGPTPRGVAARPTLRNPNERTGVAATPGGERPAGAVSPGTAGEHAGVVAAPRATPALRTPGERPGVAGSGEHLGATPALRTPGEHPGLAGAGEHPGVAGAGEHPGLAGAGEHPGLAGAGEHPRVEATPGGLPALRTPGERQAGPPPIEHGVPGSVGVNHATAGIARPGIPAAGGEPGRPIGPQIARPANIPSPEAGHPAFSTGVQHPSPAFVTHTPTPQIHAGPSPQMHAVAPQMHVAPRPVPQMHTMSRPSPAPQMHAMSRPAPQMHVMSRPAPQMHAMSRPAPQVHSAPAPQMHASAAPAHHDEKRK